MNTLKTRNGFSMIETLFAMLIATVLTTIAINYNKDTLNTTTSTITKNTSLQQDTISAFQNITTDLSEGNQVVKDFTTAQNKVSIQKVDCDNGDKGYIVITTSKNCGDTFASLDTCSQTNLDLNPIIGSFKKEEMKNESKIFKYFSCF